jgi:poly [ADP-ribose] polymerase
MPPRKKKAAAPVNPPLTGFNIAISGTIPKYTQASIERDFITTLGGTLAKTISSSTTHLVTTEADYEKPSAKVKSAQANGIPIVTFQWLEDCLTQNTHLAESGYEVVTQSQAHTGSPAQQPNASRKRPAPQTSQSDGDANAPPPPNKKGKADNDEPKEREAKVAEGQIAKSFDVKIPVDEGAVRELPNYEVYIDDSGVIYDASLNQTNASSNNNKFYRIQVRPMTDVPHHLIPAIMKPHCIDCYLLLTTAVVTTYTHLLSLVMAPY